MATRRLYLGDTAQTVWQRVMFQRSILEAQLKFPRLWYQMLDAYYLNNALYDDVMGALDERAIWTPGMKALRNPANRAVEFYVSKLWPGSLPKALPIVTDNRRIIPPIEQIWSWSNWATQKQTVARQLSIFGDVFIKIAQKKEGDEITRVYLDPIKAQNVVDFELDERGFIIYIRFDVPDGEETHTEVWSKRFGGLRVWKHKYGLDRPLDELGNPTEVLSFEELQFDFIPVVHAKFRDIGNPRGVGCFVHGLDKIDEANRQATRLHQILFRYNKPTKAVMANDTDSQGRPLPPPTITGHVNSSSSQGVVVEGDDDLWLMPGKSSLEQMVPNIDYDAALNIINAQMDELSKDLPEILYYELKDRELSGTALRTLLGPAIDRAVEARGNMEPALIRAHEMALTIATVHNLIEPIGSYEQGDFIHVFAERDVIARNSNEKAEAIQAETQSGIPLITAMKHHGYSDEEIAAMTKTEEYKLTLTAKAMLAVKTAVEAGMALETALSTIANWTPDQLETMGMQKLAQLTLEQEDYIPEVTQ